MQVPFNKIEGVGGEVHYLLWIRLIYVFRPDPWLKLKPILIIVGLGAQQHPAPTGSSTMAWLISE